MIEHHGGKIVEDVGDVEEIATNLLCLGQQGTSP